VQAACPFYYVPGYDKYLQLEAEVGLLENPGAFLATEIAAAFAKRESNDGFFRIHVPAADGIFLDHGEKCAFPLFIRRPFIVRVKKRLYSDR
jgi:hypothetical protein